MDIKNELKDKLEKFINGNISKDKLYEWALNCCYEGFPNPQDKKDETLFNHIFGDLLVLDEPEWCDLTPEKIKYYYNCLIGKEIFDEAKADSLSKKIFGK